ncbi:kinase-like protein [Testicularia cyperi]|uniref:Kinase-like protein n=1 Tax=Testicularia cyperi TaxID=1882483 RepID=A0A317XI09_9BASI|nr:kinase-like protein [Testicularia cyperi]
MQRKASGGAGSSGYGSDAHAGTSNKTGFSPVLSPRNSTSKEASGKDTGLSRMAKMRAAMHIGSVYDDWPMYSANGDDYIIGDVIGMGASSVVHQGVFKPLDKACAIKIIDLEAYGRDTEELRRETQLMSLSKHPNVLRVRGCWVKGAKLHIATRLMSSGSMLDIMRFSSPEGFDEIVIATVLKQALEGLNYLHVNGWLHRDLKAANILVDEDGTVLLGDFGVGVFVGESDKASGSEVSEGKRKSFVGTPCWMAPEVIERKHYGTKADIWSFGITALELAQGRAPNSRLNPVKVLMRTMQDEPPRLDRTGGAHKYSKVMDDFVRACLQKDPERRPTADKLLSHSFFKQAKPPRYLVTTILAGLPPLAARQERRRNASINTTHHYLSWDFGTINSRTTTPNLEKLDPFRNFTGVISLPSPHGSVRSTKLVSIDGQHVLATEEDDEVPSLARRFASTDDSPRKENFSQNSLSRRRNRSLDALGHRKSVSFEGSADNGRPMDGSTELYPGGSTLAPIGERNSPMAGAASSSDGEDVPVLDLQREAGQPAKIVTLSKEEDSCSRLDNAGLRHTSDSQAESSTTAGPDAPGRIVETSATVPTGARPSSIGSGASQSKLMLQRTTSKLLGGGGGSGGGGKKQDGERSIEAGEKRHSRRESVFGKLFKGSSSRKEGRV